MILPSASTEALNQAVASQSVKNETKPSSANPARRQVANDAARMGITIMGNTTMASSNANLLRHHYPLIKSNLNGAINSSNLIGHKSGLMSTDRLIE